VTFCDGDVLEPRHLPPRVASNTEENGRPAGATDTPAPTSATGSNGLPAGDVILPLREIETRYVRQVLDRVGGNKRRAAALLGISRRTLYRRLDGEVEEE
ncbi:MAG: helix-turn-helix domain-containing protein, partial [Longimicrobiales bacterium]